MNSLMQDLRYALRMMARSPGFTVATLALLVLTLAANNAIFGLVNSILLRPLPQVKEPARLFGIADNVISYPTYLDLRDQAKELIDLAGYANRSAAASVAGASVLGRAQLVTGSYFRVVGCPAALGRLLGPADDRPEAPPVAVVSHRFYEASLHADPATMGRVLTVNGVAAEIVGVTAAGFHGMRVTEAPDFFLPVALWPKIAPSSYKGLGLERRSWGWMSVVGRMAPGVTLAQVQAAFDGSLRRERELYPRDGGPGSVRLAGAVLLAPGNPATREIMIRFFGILAAVVALILLIGCANVANLLLARGSARRREIAVRLSIGASSTRLMRQLLTESLLLASIAGGLSLLAVQFINEVLTRFTLPGGASLGALDLNPGWPMVIFTSLAALLTGALFGLAPALRSTRVDLVRDLRDAGGGTKASRRRGGSLLVVQVTLSVVLLAGAGLFLRSLQRALSIDPGFRTEQVAVAEVDLGLVRYEPEQAVRFYDEATRRVAALPGVRAVSWTSLTPLADESDKESLEVEGYTRALDETPVATVNIVGAGYARLMGISVLQGREFTPLDRAGSPRVVMVNESLARRYWQGRHPLGSRVKVAGQDFTVVGVLKDVTLRNLTDAPVPTLFLPLAQEPAMMSLFWMKMLVHTQGNPADIVGPLRAQIARIDRNAPIVGAGTLQELLDALLTPQRLAASLMGWLGALALVIVAVGVYGVAAYEAARRTREIGIRVALGATPSSLLRLVLGRTLGCLALGIILGAPLAVALGSVASSFLYGIGAADPITYAVTALVLVSAGALASYLPARRAARVDPMTALRCE